MKLWDVRKINAPLHVRFRYCINNQSLHRRRSSIGIILAFPGILRPPQCERHN